MVKVTTVQSVSGVNPEKKFNLAGLKQIPDLAELAKRADRGIAYHNAIVVCDSGCSLKSLSSVDDGNATTQEMDAYIGLLEGRRLRELGKTLDSDHSSKGCTPAERENCCQHGGNAAHLARAAELKIEIAQFKTALRLFKDHVEGLKK